MSEFSMTTLKKWSLPVFLTPRNKYPVGLFLGAIAAFLYLTSNHYHFFQPKLLPMSWIDESVPFLPWTVWVYVTEYFLFAAVYVCARDLVNANKYLYSFLGLQIVSVTIFWIWPTTFPRGDFPLPDTLDPFTYYLFSNLRATDDPSSCAPSLHVSSCYLSSYIYLDEQKKLFPFFFLWASAIAVSTLTTKQHYLIDIVTGFILSILIYWVFHRWVQYRPYGAQANR